MLTRTYDDLISRLHSKNKYEDMPASAEALLALLPSDEYPLPVIKLAKKLGFKVFTVDMNDDDLSGFIAIDPALKKDYETSRIIMVNSNDTNEHKRFTIAHELAHYIFDAAPGQEYYNTYRTDESKWDENKTNTDDRERAANYFAANLLMPSLDFRRKYNEFTIESNISNREQITRQLAKFFGVPETAVEIRYKELELQEIC